ncbi:MAG: diguanylate cyclase [Parasporobacterium sp.]|nr:diguanylate cyclase [Parasporobacterium sp.]
MKKLDLLKTIQLIVFVIFAGISLKLILFTPSVTNELSGGNEGLRTLCTLFWIIFALIFLFIFLDLVLYNKEKQTLSQLKKRVTRDTISQLENRHGCDTLINRYTNQELNDDVAAVTLELANIKEINDKHGHEAGNSAIRDFSTVISYAAIGKCFVGRNGGNKYLAFFEKDGKRGIKEFMNRLNDKLNEYNEKPGSPSLEYRYGIAYTKDTKDRNILSLIALSDNRLTRYSQQVTAQLEQEKKEAEMSEQLQAEQLYTEMIQDEPIPEDTAFNETAPTAEDVARSTEVDDAASDVVAALFEEDK